MKRIKPIHVLLSLAYIFALGLFVNAAKEIVQDTNSAIPLLDRVFMAVILFFVMWVCGMLLYTIIKQENDEQ
jgi:hypothetical protein